MSGPLKDLSMKEIMLLAKKKKILIPAFNKV